MAGGKYLHPRQREQLRRQRRRRLARKRAELVLMLLGGATLTVYMIARGLMDGAFGAGLTAVLSAYFGYQLKGVIR